MKQRIVLLFLLATCILVNNSYAQGAAPKNYRTYKVGIFAPLYLDSVFNDNGYKYSKNNFPKFTVQGLDFVQGAQIALDSMPLFNGNIHATFYDSRSYTNPLSGLIHDKSIDSLDLIIGAVKDQDYLQLANFAQQRNIPFISAVYPNDGGVVSNPFLVIVNSTLKAHCEAIYSYLLQNHGNERIVLVRKPGAQEDKVAAYFKNINDQDGKELLNIQVINIPDNNFSGLKNKLDSLHRNVIIGGSLSEDFALKLATEAASISKTYSSTLIGMPNWDGFTFVSRKNTLKDYPVYYTTPYYNSKWDAQSKMIQAVYKKCYKSSPSDMTYKGFESVYLFARLLTRYPDDYMGHLNDYPYKVFNEYIFKPVFLTKKSTVPDYFENKRLYFMKSMNGSVSKAW
jgi:hypothetical protein